MINLRIYRATLLLIPIAIAVAMFSLESVPDPRTSTVAPDAFDGSRAATGARDLAAAAPNPTPGSEADARLARKVGQRFGQIEGAQVSEQVFDGSFEGEDVELRNVICVLPGETEDQVVLMAGRDAIRGPGVATAAASTAALLEIADSFGGSTHQKTLVFVSSDGSGLGAAGARRFGEDYNNIDRVQAMAILSQPAARGPHQPLLIPWSSGPQSTSIQLAETVATAIGNETDFAPEDENAFSELSRLALPSGLGEQAPLVEDGIDAVRISSSGERPPEPADDGRNDVSADALGQFGRAALATMLAFDETKEPFEHGPEAYVGLFGNLLPGWALSLVAASLLVPLILVAIDGIVRAVRRRPDAVLLSVGWVVGRSLPFFAALLLTYLFVFVGFIPSPDFPFDPGRFSVDTEDKIVLGILAATLLAGLYLIKPYRPAPPLASEAGAPVCVTLIALAGVGVWVANPFLALLLAPALHAWVLLNAEETAVGSVLASAMTFIGLLPLIAAVAVVADHFGVGWKIGWLSLMLIGDGQIGIALTLLGCVLAGCGLGSLALARSRIVREPPEISVEGPPISVSGPS